VIGKTISHYRILSQLGTGGMGIVYAGEDIRLGRPVALKFVSEELSRDHQAVERFHAEARTASGLNHTNICTIYDIGEYEGQPFIVMELLKGHTLRDRLTGAPLKIHEVVDLGIQVADALDSAHRHDIIHRDIKPANLFLVDRGPVKILDFGLAKLTSPATATATTERPTRDRTTQGMTLGTVSYMSPEQVTGEVLDGRTDLFSLGVVLYEAATQHQPFTGKTSAVIFSAILTRAPVAPVVFNPEVPLRLQEVINNCLEKDRELRYQDAAGLRADLRRIRRDLESGHSGVFAISGAAERSEAPSLRADSAPAASATPVEGRTGRHRYGPMAAAAILAAALTAVASFWLLSRGRFSVDAPRFTASQDFTRTRLGLATASLESRDYRGALAYAEDVLRTAPDNLEANRIRETARSMLKRFDDAVATASDLLSAGDTAGAASAVATARAIDPSAPIVGQLSARLTNQVKPEETKRSTRTSPPVSQRATANTPVQPDASATRVPDEPTPVVSPQETAQPPTVVATPPPRPEPPVVAAPTSAAPAAPAASPRPEATEARDGVGARGAETDDVAIRRVVATYARAIEMKDLALFRSVKPNLSADEQRRIEDGFRAVTSQRVSVTILSIDQRGQDASVRLRRRDTIQAGGRQQTSETVQTMTLTRSASGWTIRELGR
jgi:hypothetical protein